MKEEKWLYSLEDLRNLRASAGSLLNPAGCEYAVLIVVHICCQSYAYYFENPRYHRAARLWLFSVHPPLNLHYIVFPTMQSMWYFHARIDKIGNNRKFK